MLGEFPNRFCLTCTVRRTYGAKGITLFVKPSQHTEGKSAMKILAAWRLSVQHAALSVLALMALAAPRAQADPQYTITDLGTLGGTYSYA